ncbi:SLAM family member 5-like isoform X1 [Lepisosteus oculatus]|uniref:SLAM family member 5-like isoform X1 n=1 Tax=Lepisosteus oculatus TaxID=7918 RepID=UPI00371D08C4
MCGFSIHNYFSSVLHFYIFLNGINLPLSLSAEENVTGTVGGSVTLPSGVQSVSVQDVVLIDWKYKGKAIAQFIGGKTNPDLSPQFRGRIQMSDQSGDLTLTQLRLDDSGTYTFTGIREKGPQIPIKIINLQVYEYIDKVQIKNLILTSSNQTCKISMVCNSDKGGENVSYTWKTAGYTTNGSKFEYFFNQETNFTCIARNAVSNKSETIVQNCIITEVEYMKYIYIGGAAFILLMLVIVFLVICCRMGKGKDSDTTPEPTTIYAEIESQSMRKKQSAGRTDGQQSDRSPMTIYDSVDNIPTSQFTTSKLPQTLYDTVTFNRTEDSLDSSKYQRVL